jgi:hypothetical protein
MGACQSGGKGEEREGKGRVVHASNGEHSDGLTLKPCAGTLHPPVMN